MQNNTLSLSSFMFFGRERAEYEAFFELGDLTGRRVLDVAAGPSSFTAEISRDTAHAVAVDPLYGLRHDALRAQLLRDYRRMEGELRKKENLLKLSELNATDQRIRRFPSIESAMASRRRAAGIFLRDYDERFVQGRYVGASLPNLPFADASFDVVLCAHLLFIYEGLLDFDFHVQACRELMRVSCGLVQIYPICGLDGQVSRMLEGLTDILSEHGICCEIVSVDHGFFAGSGRRLNLRCENQA